MQLQKQINAKNFAPATYEKTAVLNPEEAAIFANTHLTKKISDMQKNVDKIKESLKKAAEQKTKTDTKTEPGTASSISIGIDLAEVINEEEDKKPKFEYIPG